MLSIITTISNYRQQSLPFEHFIVYSLTNINLLSVLFFLIISDTGKCEAVEL